MDIAEAIEAYDRIAEHIGSCGDGYCVIKRPVGMHTNGGCRCWQDKYKAQRMMMAAANLRAAIATAMEDNEKLKAALRFYANPAVYAPHPHGPAFDRRDISYRAKNILAEVGDEELPPNFAACCNSTDLAACDCVNPQHIRVLFARGGRKYQPTGEKL